MDGQRNETTSAPVEPLVRLPDGDGGDDGAEYHCNGITMPAMDLLWALIKYVGPSFNDLCIGAIRHEHHHGKLQYDDGIDIDELVAVGHVRGDMTHDVPVGKLIWTGYQDRESFRPKE